MTVDVKQETSRTRETASPSDVIKRDVRQDKQPYATEAENDERAARREGADAQRPTRGTPRTGS